MIKIRTCTHGGKIRRIELSGHSGSAESGKDLICAAVSAVSTGLCNALHELQCDAECTVENNRIIITTEDDSEKTQTVLETGMIQLETIREIAEQFIQIRKTEV